MTVTSANHQTRKLKSLAMNTLCIACALLVMLPLVVVLFYLVSKGASSVNWAFFTQLPHGPNTPGAGMANAIVGTLQLLLLTSFVGIPAGVLGGVYLSEYGGERMNRWIRFWADVLNGVPSIVWGMLAYALVVLPMKGFSAWAGGLALGFIMLPLVLRTTEEVLVLVPRSYREAALALGLPQWKTIMMIVLPTAMRGIVTGILLAMGRIAGETAPLLFTALGNDYWNKNLAKPIAALPLQIFKYAISGFDEWHRQAWAGALVLVGMTFCLSLGVRIFSAGRFQKKHMNPTMTPEETKTASRVQSEKPAAAPRPETKPAAAPANSQAVPAISVKNLSVFFGKNQVLKSVSLNIEARAVTAIIGPSGCGKSTFLRSLNRMHELVATSRVEGDIRLFGEDIYSKSVEPVIVRRRVGMVFQKSNPFPTMSIGENVIVGLKLNGVRNRAVLAEQTEKSLRMAALWDEVKDRLNAPAVSLSGGQQQRLCIARALAVQPEVLLMDEPASALDPLATSKIEDLIRELRKDYTIVIVTHNMQQAARASDHTAFFYMGELVEFDTTAQIFTSPKQKRTEDYVTGRFG